jgi:hypothetical protein
MNLIAPAISSPVPPVSKITGWIAGPYWLHALHHFRGDLE